MELEEAIRRRRSVRSFKADPVPRSVVEHLLELAQWAPSGMNQQNWYFVVVTGPRVEALRRLATKAFDEHVRPHLEQVFPDKPQVVEATGRFFRTLGGAPVVICAYHAPTVEGELTDLQSVAAAIQNLLLAAVAHGLGACWMTGPVHLAEEINSITGVHDKKLQAIIPLGYPEGQAPTPKRKPERVLWIGWE
ncbi:MAG: nitroreductase family protein [Calditrichaeota bacterium]|nr:nitroreductase family protein [Calditrichota bacterium]